MPATEAPAWVVGSGGLLGSALDRGLSRLTNLHLAPPVNWAHQSACGELATSATTFTSAVDRWVVFWAAGAGIIGTGEAELERETSLLAALLDGLADSRGPGAFVLASSAGGIHAGAPTLPIDERQLPSPTSPYGRNKLAQEDLVARWARETGHRAAISRIANIYGPGQRFSKPQGLVSHICRATLLRQPLAIYMPLDTLRDYIFVDDCAAALRDMATRVWHRPPGSTTIKLVATGRSITIGALLAECRRVIGRPTTAIMAQSPRAAQQPPALAFRSSVWPTLAGTPRTPLPAGIHRTTMDLRLRLQRGSLA